MPQTSFAAPNVRLEPGVVYARRTTGDLVLDLYRPLSTGHAVPVVIWLHGGGWFAGDRTLAPDLVAHVLATGHAVASIEYRLSGQALFPTQLHDVRSAVRFLRQHADSYEIDAAAIGLWGASAGGHLAALAGLTGHIDLLPAEEGPAGDVSVQAVAASYAPVDLARIVAAHQEANPHLDGAATPEGRLLGAHPGDVPGIARQANPLNWIGTAPPPFQLSHGTGDVLVPHGQSELLHEALLTAGGQSELYLLQDYKHGFLNPSGRLDVDMQSVMDDGRLATEVRAAARRKTTRSGPMEETTFGFLDIETFFRRCLNNKRELVKKGETL
ncbi:alpha/beta hydrolase [Paenarthrobacter sp. A20]|uniref:alpha/beta hydrolase n=1 Tax=Paenarthrobacter sp. A20 TaxID=2817891 RepID=UPI00209FE767|nr:alpha/beta hydrolase [Paenarthrobacter sp. A20]MCP1415586.1 acetyl esterase/lipase [Paenarthrobacter sp. A20]